MEDDLSLIDGLQYTLEKNDFVVDNARTVKEAYAFFRANKYDLILLDITLPDGTGYDVCREVRRTSTIPIIFLTASDEEVSIVKGLDMGGDDSNHVSVYQAFPYYHPFSSLSYGGVGEIRTLAPHFCSLTV